MNNNSIFRKLKKVNPKPDDIHIAITVNGRREILAFSEDDAREAFDLSCAYVRGYRNGEITDNIIDWLTKENDIRFFHIGADIEINLDDDTFTNNHPDVFEKVITQNSIKTEEKNAPKSMSPKQIKKLEKEKLIKAKKLIDDELREVGHIEDTSDLGNEASLFKISTQVTESTETEEIDKMCNLIRSKIMKNYQKVEISNKVYYKSKGKK